MNSVEMLISANEDLRIKKYSGAVDKFRALSIFSKSGRYKDSLRFSLERAAAHSMEVERKSILFVSSGIKGPTPGGGIATCFSNMLGVVSKYSDSRVTLLYSAHPFYSKGNYEYWKGKFKDELNVDLIVIEQNNNYGSKEMKRSFAISELILEMDGVFDTVVFHDFYGLGYFTLLARKLGLGLASTRIVISAHGNHQLSYHFGSKKVKDWSESAVMFMERMSLKWADLVTTPSQYYADWFEEQFGLDNTWHQPNIIKYEHPEGDSIELDLEGGRLNLFFYGRVERLKGVDILVEAVKQLIDLGEQVNVCLVGNNSTIDGVGGDEYVRGKLSDTSANIYFKANVSPTRFFELVKDKGGIVLYPTMGETSSCVVVESIINKVPFLVSDIPGIKELVDPELHEAVMFSTGKAKSLVERILQRKNAGFEFVGRLAFDMQKNEMEWVELLTDSTRVASGRELKPISDVSAQVEKVSVVIPTSDRPQLLDVALRSIAEQTYRNIEIIVYDDASEFPEENEEVCARYGARYLLGKSKVYKGAACNEAVKHCSSDFICFFDDDDIAYPNMIETYVRAFSQSPDVDVLSCFADCFEHASWESTGDVSVEYTSLALGNSLETNLMANFFGKGTFIIRRSAFEKAGGYFEDSDPVPMVDYRFYIKASLAGANIQVVPKGMYAYRKNSPKSLFYENKDNKRMLFLAKRGVETAFRNAFGDAFGRSFGHVVWNLSLPAFD